MGVDDWYSDSSSQRGEGNQASAVSCVPRSPLLPLLLGLWPTRGAPSSSSGQNRINSRLARPSSPTVPVHSLDSLVVSYLCDRFSSIVLSLRAVTAYWWNMFVLVSVLITPLGLSTSSRGLLGRSDAG